MIKFAGNDTSANFVSLNAKSPIVCKLLWKLNSLIFVFENAYFPILTKLELSLILIIDNADKKKAEPPMYNTLSGKSNV